MIAKHQANVSSAFNYAHRRRVMIEKLENFDTTLLNDENFESFFLECFKITPNDFHPAIKKLINFYRNGSDYQEELLKIIKAQSNLIDQTLLENQITQSGKEISALLTALDSNLSNETSNKNNELKDWLKEQQNTLQKLVELQIAIQNIKLQGQDDIKKVCAFIEFLCNALLKLPNLEGMIKEEYQLIMKEIGNFLYDEGCNLFDDKNLQNAYPLLFLVIAGVADDNTYKQKSYLRFLPKQEGVVPGLLNLETYCTEKPLEFIEMYASMCSTHFISHLKSWINKNNPECKLEYAKLLLLLARAEQSISNNNNNNNDRLASNLKTAKDLLLDLCNKDYKRAEVYLEKYFNDDFDAIMTLYVNHRGKEKEQEFLYLANAIFTRIKKEIYTDNEMSFAYYLYQDAINTNSKPNLKKAADILYHAGKTKTTAIAYLQDLASTDAHAALLVGKLVSAYDVNDAKSWFTFAASSGNVEAHYRLYVLDNDKNKLLLSAEGGCKRAIKELNKLITAFSIRNADDSDIKFIVMANYKLGLMHLYGNEVETNYELAKHYFTNAHFQHSDAKLQLIRMVVNKQIEIDDHSFILLLKQAIKTYDIADQAFSIAEDIIKSDSYAKEIRFELANFLANLLSSMSNQIRNDKKMVELAELCYLLKPERYEFIQTIFFDAKLRSFLSNKTLANLFSKLYLEIKCILNDGFHAEIVDDFVSKNDKDLNELLLTYPDLKKHLSHAELATLENQHTEIANVNNHGRFFKRNLETIEDSSTNLHQQQLP